MKTSRSYTMDARARAVEATRTRIADALFALASRHRLAEISLDDVAAAAGVSVQTVLRHYGSRSGLIEGVRDYATARIVEERTAPVGDVDGAIRILLDHYEKHGRMSLLFLAQEDDDAVIAGITTRGKRVHRDWVSEVFAPFATGDDALLDLLVVATDVYTWKLLRLDRQLSRSRVQQRMATLVRAVLDAPARTEED
ncbi:MAG TPA: TetR/AcrR family transcriptional regulator [Marmoricola sp.]|nr:TetR/AcrR family transcriptional regulator [Marmoricola sp.]